MKKKSKFLSRAISREMAMASDSDARKVSPPESVFTLRRSLPARKSTTKNSPLFSSYSSEYLPPVSSPSFSDAVTVKSLTYSAATNSVNALALVSRASEAYLSNAFFRSGKSLFGFRFFCEIFAGNREFFALGNDRIVKFLPFVGDVFGCDARVFDLFGFDFAAIAHGGFVGGESRFGGCFFDTDLFEQSPRPIEFTVDFLASGGKTIQFGNDFFKFSVPGNRKLTEVASEFGNAFFGITDVSRDDLFVVSDRIRLFVDLNREIGEFFLDVDEFSDNCRNSFKFAFVLRRRRRFSLFDLLFFDRFRPFEFVKRCRCRASRSGCLGKSCASRNCTLFGGFEFRRGCRSVARFRFCDFGYFTAAKPGQTSPARTCEQTSASASRPVISSSFFRAAASAFSALSAAFSLSLAALPQAFHSASATAIFFIVSLSFFSAAASSAFADRAFRFAF